MKLSIASLSEQAPVLSGAAEGRRVLADLIARTPNFREPAPLFLDFQGIKVATASFLRESVVFFRNHSRKSHSNIYPVLANLAVPISEELRFYANATNDVFLCCEIDENNHSYDGHLIGKLDAAQEFTFEALKKCGPSTASHLAIRFKDQNIGPTAWSNRLSALASKGLLVEQKQGKSKIFRLVLEVA